MHIPNSPSLDMNLGLNQSQVLVGSGLNHGSELNVTTPSPNGQLTKEMGCASQSKTHQLYRTLKPLCSI